jgi:hypothetical protein
VAGVVAEAYVFSCLIPLNCRDSFEGLLAFDHGHDVFFTHDHQLVAIHLHFGTAVLAEQNLVADLDVERANFAVSKILPLPTATTFPKMGFSVAVSGITMPPGDLRSSSSRFTITRS